MHGTHLVRNARVICSPGYKECIKIGNRVSMGLTWNIVSLMLPSFFPMKGVSKQCSHGSEPLVARIGKPTWLRTPLCVMITTAVLFTFSFTYIENGYGLIEEAMNSGWAIGHLVPCLNYNKSNDKNNYSLSWGGLIIISSHKGLLDMLAQLICSLYLDWRKFSPRLTNTRRVFVNLILNAIDKCVFF